MRRYERSPSSAAAAFVGSLAGALVGSLGGFSAVLGWPLSSENLAYAIELGLCAGAVLAVPFATTAHLLERLHWHQALLAALAASGSILFAFMFYWVGSSAAC